MYNVDEFNIDTCPITGREGIAYHCWSCPCEDVAREENEASNIEYKRLYDLGYRDL